MYIHSGSVARYGYAFFHELQVHAARGYVVFYTNPGGSMGREEQFATCISERWDELDEQDIMATADFAESLLFVDRQRMAAVYYFRDSYVSRRD